MRCSCSLDYTALLFLPLQATFSVLKSKLFNSYLKLKDDSKLYFRDSVFKVQVKGIILSKLKTSDVCVWKLMLPVMSPSQET